MITAVCHTDISFYLERNHLKGTNFRNLVVLIYTHDGRSPKYCGYASGHYRHASCTDRRTFQPGLHISPHCLNPLLTHDVSIDVNVYTWNSLITDRALGHGKFSSAETLRLHIHTHTHTQTRVGLLPFRVLT
jgi:hypothetical protein